MSYVTVTFAPPTTIHFCSLKCVNERQQQADTFCQDPQQDEAPPEEEVPPEDAPPDVPAPGEVTATDAQASDSSVDSGGGALKRPAAETPPPM